MKLLSLLPASAALIIAVPAQAATLLFKLTGAYNGQFLLDSEPVPDTVNIGGFKVLLTGAYDSAFFWNSNFGGGLSLYAPGNNVLFDSYGPRLYSGSDSAPSFGPGTYWLGGSVLTISTVTSAVPESAAWAMMIGGFGLVGGAMRVRSRKLSFKRA
jgi:hypothetical protein